MTRPSTDWWNAQRPETFLAENWHHPSRVYAAMQVLIHAQEAANALAKRSTILEVGPGSGHDYRTFFQPWVKAGMFDYIGAEPTATFRQSLIERFPDVSWVNVALQELHPAVTFGDVVYCRAVLEHQPALEPAFTNLLRATCFALVIDFYRPPWQHSPVDAIWEGVHQWTFNELDLQLIANREGCELDVREKVADNEVWIFRRVSHE